MHLYTKNIRVYILLFLLNYNLAHISNQTAAERNMNHQSNPIYIIKYHGQLIKKIRRLFQNYSTLYFESHDLKFEQITYLRNIIPEYYYF